MKQVPVPFKIYADFESNLEGVESDEGSYTKKEYQDQVPCNFADKVVCIDDKFSKPIVFIGENFAYKFIKEILEEYKYCK